MSGHYGQRHPGSRFPRFRQHAPQAYYSQNHQESHHIIDTQNHHLGGSYSGDQMITSSEHVVVSDAGYYQDGSFDVFSGSDGQAGTSGDSTSYAYYHEPSPIASWTSSENSQSFAGKQPRAHRQKFRQERDSRSATPEPVRTPSPSYLSVAREPPSTIQTPSSLRKLLILDLNGTLVHRSTRQPWPRGAKPVPGERPLDVNGRPLPALRPVHPRPYMNAFREYLFCEETRAWLDVMVWSSAQPHSVRDMVENCFGEEKEKLVAVWARDTLGLSDDRYYRKVQTIKDLTKPWTALPILGASSSPSASSPPPSSQTVPTSAPSSRSPTPPGLRPLSKPASPSANAHSAQTTLLLDDSPAKAARQPHNHVCIPEYTAGRRAKDVLSLEKEREWEREREVREALAAGEISLSADTDNVTAEGSLGEGVDDAPDAQASGSLSPGRTVDGEDSAVDPETRKRKRREKKLRKRAAKLGSVPAAPPATDFDPTLLAVVGVLEEVKRQANAAAWICTGGLWGPSGKPGKPGSQGRNEEEEGEPTTPGVERDEKRQKLRDTSAATQPCEGVHTPATTGAEAGNDETTAVSPAPDFGVHSVSPNAQEIDKSSEQGEQAKLWFEHSPTLAYWAERGRNALEELGIEVVHGLDR